MKIILGITSVLLLAVFSMAFLYFSNLTVDSRSNDKTLAAIPFDASVIFNFSNDKSLYEIFKDYTLFDAIIGNDKKSELSWIKALLLENRDLHSATQGGKVFLSFHPIQTDSLQFLWVMPLQDNLELAEVQEALIKLADNQVKTTTNLGVSLIEVRNKLIENIFYIGIDRGIARGSFSKTLLLSSLDKNAKKITKEFINEINDAMLKEDDALASLYINHRNPGFMKPFFNQNLTGNFGLFGSFPAYSNLHLNYKSDALMFNGISSITEKHDGYLNLFLKQEPVKNTIKRIIPSNVSNVICYGLSDYALFNTGLRRLFSIRKELVKLDEQIQFITAETGINPDRDIRKLWGNEFSNIQLSTTEKFAVITISNGRQLQFYLDALSMSYSDAVRKMNFENLFYFYFGDPLKMYSKPYFAITDNLLILSNSPGTVQRFLNDYNSEKLLYTNESFTRFDQLVADQSNISFLLQLKNSENLVQSLLKTNYSRVFKSNEFGLKDFYGLSFQLTSNKEHFFTNFYLGYDKTASVSSDSIVYSEDSSR